MDVSLVFAYIKMIFIAHKMQRVITDIISKGCLVVRMWTKVMGSIARAAKVFETNNVCFPNLPEKDNTRLYKRKEKKTITAIVYAAY